MHSRLKAFLLTLLALPAAAETLHVLTWSEYFNPDVARRFEDSCGCQLQFILFEDEDQRDHLLLNSSAGSVDLVLLDMVKARQFQRQDWLIPLSMPVDADQGEVIEQFYHQHPVLRQYTQPYFWGTIGILYHRGRITPPPRHWRDLFSGAPELHRRIVMPSSAEELFALAQLANGANLSSEQPQDIAAAMTILQRQAPSVLVYGYPPLNGQSPLIGGDAALWPTYNGDALTLMKRFPELGFVLPDEGSPLWVDLWAMPRGANRPLAERFLAFIRHPAVMAELASYLNYLPPDPAAEALLPEEFRRQPAIHLTQAQRQRLQPFVEYSNHTIRQLYDMLDSLTGTP